MVETTPGVINPSRVQTAALTATWCHELLFGGAAGAGKSFYLLVDFLQDVPKYGASWRGILFRRTSHELQELIDISTELFPATGGVYRASQHRWDWPNGSRLKLWYLEKRQDTSRFQGQSFTWIGWDELTQWPDDFAYRYLRARLRSKDPLVTTKRIRSTSNPGGPGHHWVKQHFVDYAPGGYRPRVDKETSHKVMFIPGRIKDNPYLSENDPTYISRLQGLGSPSMVRAWLDGDWSVIEGAFFDNWEMTRHVVPPFEVPGHWSRFLVADHGSAEPFACLWFAIAQDAHVVQRRDNTITVIPRGALVCYREWYGWDGVHANRGIKLPAEDIATGILAREAEEPRDINGKSGIRRRIMDVGEGATSGPSIYERMASKGVYCERPNGLKARTTRHGKIGGWDMVRHRLGEVGDQAMLFFFSTCAQTIRTLPALQHDVANPEDVAPGEDHCGDVVRMACMSRPFIRRNAPPPPPVISDPSPQGVIMGDINAMFQGEERRQKRLSMLGGHRV